AARSPQPTPYRYASLIDRAKQLNQLAQQVENSYFAALQQQDAESYNLLKANQDLELAGANLDLQALQVSEALDGVTQATDQKARAQTQLDTYDNWISAGPLSSESDMLQAYQDENTARDWVAGLDAAYSGLQLAVSAASGALFSGGASAALAVGGAAIS